MHQSDTVLIPYVPLAVPLRYTNGVLVASLVSRQLIFHDPPQPFDVKFQNIVLRDDILPLSFREVGLLSSFVEDANPSLYIVRTPSLSGVVNLLAW